MSPTILDAPTASKMDRQRIITKCKRLCTSKKKTTRQHIACANCVRMQSQLTHQSKQYEQRITNQESQMATKIDCLNKEVQRLRTKVSELKNELEKQREETIRAKGDRHGDVQRCVVGAVLSGLQFWQYRRFFQIVGILGLCDRKKWDRVVQTIYIGIKNVVEWSTSYLVIQVKGNKRSCAADVRWSHVGYHAKHCTAIIVDVSSDSIIARIHVSQDDNKHDQDMHKWTESSGAMEGKALELCFKRLKELGYNIEFCSFDGDSEAPKTLFSYYPYATPTRDPSHQGKNCMKMLKRVMQTFKYNCDCGYVISEKTGNKKKDSGGKFLRDHNYITPTTMKKFQSRISYILMNTKTRAAVKTKIRGAMKHLFGKCEPGDGCTHATEFVHKNPVNCPKMIEAIKKYIENDVIEIVNQTIIEGKGAISTNTCESVMSMIKEMIDKKRFCHVMLYCVRADVAVLCKNQKFFTKMFVNDQLNIHHHWLPKVLRAIGLKVTEEQELVWRKEEIQKLKFDAKQRTSEAKLKRIKQKKEKLVTYQEEKKKSASGTSFTYESGGGSRALSSIRERRETRESLMQIVEEGESVSSTLGNTTSVWQKTDPRLNKLGQKQIKAYLETKISAIELSSLPATRRKGWLKEWRDAMLNYIQSQPGETVDVPSEWDSQPQADTTTDSTEQVLPNGLIVWQKDDPRLHSANKRQIRTYLQDKIPCAEFDELVRLGNERGSLQKWRDALVNYAHARDDDIVHVPNEWRNLQVPKKTNRGITSEMNLKGCNVIKVYFDLESTGYVRV